jgi:hypothetical protein
MQYKAYLAGQASRFAVGLHSAASPNTTKKKNAAEDALYTPAFPEQTLTSSSGFSAHDPVHASMKYLHLSLFTFGASANWKIKATTILKPNNTTLLIRPLFALGGEVDGLSFPHQAEHKLDDAEQKQNVAPDITGVKIPVMIPIVLCCC